jgi:hypothetical protein
MKPESTQPAADPAPERDYFPCELHSYGSIPQVRIEVAYGMFLFELLTEYGLSGTGRCWEGIIRDILDQDMPELLARTAFSREGDLLIASFIKTDDQLRFARHLHDICTDTDLFKKYLRNLDLQKIGC